MFRGKTVLLPCDDPEWSNFTKFFAQNLRVLYLDNGSREERGGGHRQHTEGLPLGTIYFNRNKNWQKPETEYEILI